MPTHHKLAEALTIVALSLDSRLTYLGVGHRAPVMANGQKPGIRRQYDTGYAEWLDEVFSSTHHRLSAFYARAQAAAFGGLDLSGLAPIDRQALHHMAQKADPLA